MLLGALGQNVESKTQTVANDRPKSQPRQLPSHTAALPGCQARGRPQTRGQQVRGNQVPECGANVGAAIQILTVRSRMVVPEFASQKLVPTAGPGSCPETSFLWC